jgi:C4-dicarboxylate transporter
MIIITSASRKVIQKPGVRCWKVPESLSWYLAWMVTFWSSESLPSCTALSAAIMMEIFRVLAEGTGVSPRRSARAPVVRSLRYQLVWKGRTSHSAFISWMSSCMAFSSGAGGAPAGLGLVEAGAAVDQR